MFQINSIEVSTGFYAYELGLDDIVNIRPEMITHLTRSYRFETCSHLGKVYRCFHHMRSAPPSRNCSMPFTIRAILPHVVQMSQWNVSIPYPHIYQILGHSMLFLLTLSLFAFATSVSSAFSGGEDTITDFFHSLRADSPNEVRDSLRNGDGGRRHDHASVLQERIDFKPYSRVITSDPLISWVFGNVTTSFNISIASCVKMGDMAGVYEFTNGSMKYDAKVMDIVTDLGIGTSRGTRPIWAAQTLKNALSAYDEIQAFLSEDILVSDSSAVHGKHRRDITWNSEGRILALVLKTTYGLLLGMATVEIAAAISGVKSTYGQLAAAAIVGAGGVSIYSIIDIIREEGGLTAYEPEWMESRATYVANVFVAQVRQLVILARGTSSGEAGPRYTGTELARALEELNAYSAWDAASSQMTTPQTNPLSTSSDDIQGFCDMV